jgi:hypothetical protein
LDSSLFIDFLHTISISKIGSGIVRDFCFDPCGSSGLLVIVRTFNDGVCGFFIGIYPRLIKYDIETLEGLRG